MDRPAGGRILRRAWSLILLLPCLTGGVHALPDDRNQAIYIQSDRAERDERKGLTVYTGEVEIDQGSLHISAEQVTIRSDDERVNHIEAIGKPARMQQKPAIDKEPVYARANRIRYDVNDEVLTLDGGASVTQEGAKMTGEQIVYFMREQRVKASAGAAAGQTRVQTVFPPRQTSKEAGKSEPNASPAGGPVDGSP